MGGKELDKTLSFGQDSYDIQRSPLFCAPGLVKFVPAVARLFCLALPGSFLTMLVQNNGDPCSLANYVP